MVLSKVDIEAIKSLVKDSRYEVLVKFLAERIDTIRNENVKGPTAFETLWRTAQREARQDELRRFFDDVERLNFDK